MKIAGANDMKNIKIEVFALVLLLIIIDAVILFMKANILFTFGVDIIIGALYCVRVFYSMPISLLKKIAYSISISLLNIFIGIGLIEGLDKISTIIIISILVSFVVGNTIFLIDMFLSRKK